MKTIIKNLYRVIKNYIKGARYSRKRQVFLFILLIAFLLIVRNMVTNNSVADVSRDGVRKVNLESISVLSGQGTALSLTGTVESQSEADIRAEGQGQIVRVSKNLGDRVFAGEIIAEIENNFERAQVAQAQASVDAAVAAREESSSLSSIRLENARVALEEEKVSAVNTITSAFTLAEGAILGKADQFFRNPRTSDPVLNISSFGIDDLDERRADIGDSFIVWKKTVDALSSSQDLVSLLEDAEVRLRFMSAFMRDLSSVVTRQGSSTEVTDILAGRSSIDTALSNVSNAKDSLRSADTTYKIALEEESQVTGTGLTTKEAAVRQAQAGLQLARASLEKKIIRAPISGTINSLSVSVGDVVSPSGPVAVVANNNALQIKTFITENERSLIKVGGGVQVGRYEGVVTAISPALDPTTRKIEVLIGIKDPDADLVNGQSVRVELVEAIIAESIDVREGVRVPISAINIGSEEVVVFSVNEEGSLVAHPVEVGPIFGDTILITGDIDPLLRIVVDARGLKAGSRVTVGE